MIEARLLTVASATASSRPQPAPPSALFADQRHTPVLFDAGKWVPKIQSSVITSASYPQSANQLLADTESLVC